MTVMRYISKNDREELIKFLAGLSDYLKFSQNGDDIKFIQSKIILDLKDKRIGRKSGATQTQINEAVKKIYNGTKYTKLSLNDRKQLIEKAEKSGIRSLNRSIDTNKKAFLADVAGAYDEKFLQDVLAEYYDKYQYKGKYKGKYGKNIASREYISYYEKIIFGSGLNSAILKNYNYRKNILKELTLLAECFMTDLESVQTKEIEKKMLGVIKELEKCGVKLYLTYHGNPNMPKPKKTKEYTFIISKEQTKQLAKIYEVVNSAPVGILESASIILSDVIPAFGIPLYIISQINQWIRITAQDTIKEAAKQNKRVKVKCTTLEDENFKDIEMKVIN